MFIENNVNLVVKSCASINKMFVENRKLHVVFVSDIDDFAVTFDKDASGRKRTSNEKPAVALPGYRSWVRFMDRTGRGRFELQGISFSEVAKDRVKAAGLSDYFTKIYDLKDCGGSIDETGRKIFGDKKVILEKIYCEMCEKHPDSINLLVFGDDHHRNLLSGVEANINPACKHVLGLNCLPPHNTVQERDDSEWRASKFADVGVNSIVQSHWQTPRALASAIRKRLSQQTYAEPTSYSAIQNRSV